ncbi:hypothetical protein GNI_133660 [Gregarina niphandrodes]|uniref:Uncharacterized protein n=1 Tax=Gregarina niphandrodes TaxID=110365 RepID=A0A023B148_GRENI|nr:hypothetical protein GNI_133660 [Gregarina niphandrodes]EZG46525.1 hypothetical protein GNI_133660 [Gregarina niphandrodes]|eukprot:XP_011132298.1 hypothetical protein GNI_133660 [Gregarina niphandrodes]
MHYRVFRQKSPPSTVLTILLSLGGAHTFGASRLQSKESTSRPQALLVASGRTMGVNNAPPGNTPPGPSPTVLSPTVLTPTALRPTVIMPTPLTPTRSRTVKRCAAVAPAVTPRGTWTGKVSIDNATSPPKKMCSSFRGPRKHFLDRFLTCSAESEKPLAIVVPQTVGNAGVHTIRYTPDKVDGQEDSAGRFQGNVQPNFVRPDRLVARLDECIPAFQIIFPHEEGLEISGKYLAWAYDILSHGWWHLVPFQVKKPVSVFGLAQMAAEWENIWRTNPALPANGTLGAYCYQRLGGPRYWDAVAFSDWLTSGRPAGYGDWQGRRFIPLSHVTSTLHDLLDHWPVDQSGSTSYRVNLNRWRCRYGRQRGRSFSDEAGPSGDPWVSRTEFEGLLVEMLGSLGVPLTEVSKKFRRTQRRQRICRRVAEATGAVMNDPKREMLIQAVMSDSPPSHLLGVSGKEFHIATGSETELRVPSRYLIWAYDVLNHGWWGAVPEAIFSPGLSVFELAQKAWEWETNGGCIYTLSSSCYTCGEGGKPHPAFVSCERCEKQWSPEEFWEWLRLRHFRRIWDQLKNPDHPKEDSDRLASPPVDWSQIDRHHLSEIIKEIGFDVPTKKDEYTFQICHPPITKFLPTNDYRSLTGRFKRWWSTLRGMFDKSADGFCRWEHERVILYRVSQLYCPDNPIC